MIRLMLASYTDAERQELADYLESAQKDIAVNVDCSTHKLHCHNCNMRHLCTDLLTASVYAKDFKPNPSN